MVKINMTISNLDKGYDLLEANAFIDNKGTFYLVCCDENENYYIQRFLNNGYPCIIYTITDVSIELTIEQFEKNENVTIVEIFESPNDFDIRITRT